MRISRAVPAVAAAVLSLGLLAGCGDTESAAVGSTSDAKPAAALTQQTFASTIGDTMQAAGSVHLSMSGTIVGQELAAEGDQVIGKTVADSQLGLTMKVLGMDSELRLIDQVVYFNLGALSEDKFATIDLTDTSNPLVAQFGGLAEQADIAALFESFEDAITGFEKSGDAVTIDGVKAQPYTVTVDTSKLAAAHPGGDKASIKEVPDSFQYTFFVGTDNLPRRMVVDVQDQALTLDFSKWGESVSIKKPSDSEITELDLSGFSAPA